MKFSPQRKPSLWIGFTIGVLGLGLLTIKAVSILRSQRIHAELVQIQQMMDQGRRAVAHKKLSDLAQRWPRDGQIIFLLGQCEEMLGRPDLALAAWERVPTSDPNFVRAAESRGSVLINEGRFAPAEAILFGALRSAANRSLSPLSRAGPTIPASGSMG